MKHLRILLLISGDMGGMTHLIQKADVIIVILTRVNELIDVRNAK